MPTKNNITLKLVDAETKQAFKEHPGKDGIDAFIEVEPGLEYYMRIESYCTSEILIEHKVDGKSLGYSQSLELGANCIDNGMWSYNSHNSKAEMKALQFHKALSRARIGDLQQDPNENEIGIIEVSVYEMIVLDGYHNQSSSTTELAENTQVNSCCHGNDSKKLLKTKEGKIQTTKVDNGRRQNYRKGAKLTTIKIKYCSTVGLIAAGALPKPPAWEWFKMVKPQAIYLVPDHERIQPIIFKNETRDNNGNVIESKDYEMFDMTASC